MRLAAADWADETRGPAPTHHHLAALILGSVQTGKLNLTEALLKLDLVARHQCRSAAHPYGKIMRRPLRAGELGLPEGNLSTLEDAASAACTGGTPAHSTLYRALRS